MCINGKRNNCWLYKSDLGRVSPQWCFSCCGGLFVIYFKISFTPFELGETTMSVKSSCLMHHAQGTFKKRSSKPWSVFGNQFNGMLLKRHNPYFKWIAGILSIKATRGLWIKRAAHQNEQKHLIRQLKWYKTWWISWYGEGSQGLDVRDTMLLTIWFS